MTRAVDVAGLREVLLEAGWTGATEVEHTPDGHVHVRWNGRHVEGLSVEACAEYIRRAVAVTPDDDDGSDWRETVDARSDAEPDWGGSERRLPLCSETCRQYDGKRCRLTGNRPDAICEPSVYAMSDMVESEWGV
jgi:hypothetical protein